MLLLRLIQAGFWLSVAGLTTASLLPVDMLPPQTFDIWDNAQHAGGFAWLAFWGLVAYPARPGRLALWLLVLGGAIELAQAATGWRYGEWSDWLADAVGIAAGAALWWPLRHHTPGRA